MAAGLGFKTFTTGEVLTAADTNGYLMQGVLVFASAAARDAAITSPQEGQFAYLKDTNVTTYYTGSAWTNLDTTGMTNPMTTTGDTIYSSSGSTPARLGIGSTGQVMTVAGGIPSWATPAASTPTFVGCRLFNSTNQSIPTNTSTEVTLNSEAFDTNGFHSTTTNTARITIPTGYAGKYLVTASWEWDGGSTTGARELFVRKNGNLALGNANYIGQSPHASYFQNVIFPIDLAVGDWISMWVQQNSGGNANGQCTQNYTNFSAIWLGA